MTGGQTVMNSWCAIRGMAITICQPNEFIIPNSAVIEDVLVLTKPLGTQVGRKTGLCRARSIYGCTDLFTKIRKNVRKWDYVHPYITIFQDFGIFEKSVHFHRDYLTK